MKMKILLGAFIILISFAKAQPNIIPADSLVNWNFYGIGVAKIDHEQVYLKEFTNSVGVTLLSPKKYTGDVIMRYKLMPLTAATVCVAMLNMHNNDNYEISIPNDYNGYVQFWTQESSGYFFAFHNMPHNQTPFVRRCDIKSQTNDKLQSGTKNVMFESRYYDVEVGKKGKRVWLKVDHEIVLDIEDEGENFKKGYLALRIKDGRARCRTVSEGRDRWLLASVHRPGSRLHRSDRGTAPERARDHGVPGPRRSHQLRHTAQ